MRVRIQNDSGWSNDTLITSPSGEDLSSGVQSVELSMHVGELVEAKITTLMPKVDVVAEAGWEQRCPNCGRTEEIPPDEN